nr:hypothetical protein CFP56_15436 [Quercus suber]
MEVPEAAKFREKGVLPDDLETPKEGLGDTSADSSSQNGDDDVHENKTPNLTQPSNPTQKKGKKRVLPSSTQSKGKKGGTALQLS